MRKLTPDELKKMQEPDDDLYFGKPMSADEVRRIQKALMDEMDKYYAMQVRPVFWSNMSPTDVDAKGRFEYQEPEVDEQGTYYGYKVLRIKNPDCGCPECSELVSPRYPANWKNGELTSDREPDERSMFGIHFTKRPDHPELQNYYRGDYRIAHGTYEYASFRRESSVLVKCALSGTIVETEQGFRAQHAQIIGVLYNGNWKSYSDYQERTRPDSRPNPYETREWTYEIKSRPGKRYTTDFYADWDSNP